MDGLPEDTAGCAGKGPGLAGPGPVAVSDLPGLGLAAQPVGVLGQAVHPQTRAATDHVQEEVRGDAVQPALEGDGW